MRYLVIIISLLYLLPCQSQQILDNWSATYNGHTHQTPSKYLTHGHYQPSRQNKPSFLKDTLLCYYHIEELVYPYPKPSDKPIKTDTLSLTDHQAVLGHIYQGITSPVYIDTVTYTLIPKGQIIVLREDTTLSIGQQLYIDDMLVPNREDLLLYWDPESQTDVLSMEREGEKLYTVELSDQICKTEDQKTVRIRVVSPLIVPIIPNLIVVDGRSYNSIFRILNFSEFENIALTIYTATGNKIYNTQNYANDYSFEHLPDGTYYYHLIARDLRGNRFEKKSFIEIIKK